MAGGNINSDASYLLKTCFLLSYLLYCTHKDVFFIGTAADYKDKIWKSLRDHYVRAISGSNKKSRAGRDDLLTYPHLDAISFIKPFINIRATNAVSNIQSSVNDEEESQVPLQRDDQLQISNQESNGENPTPSGDSPTGEVKLGASQTKVKQSQKEIVSQKATKRTM